MPREKNGSPASRFCLIRSKFTLFPPKWLFASTAGYFAVAKQSMNLVAGFAERGIQFAQRLSEAGKVAANTDRAGACHLQPF
jgi:hypothetical protein